MTRAALDVGIRLAILAALGTAMVGARWLIATGRARRQRRALRFGRAPEITAGSPTVLLFSGALCGDCERQKEILSELQVTHRNGWRVREVHAAAEVQLASRFGVESVPATVILDGGGRALAVNYGLIDAAALRRQLEPVLSPAAAG